MNSKVLHAVPLVALLSLSLVLAFALFHTKPPQAPHESQTGYKVTAFDIPALGGKRFSPAVWQGKVALLNVFASWCEPCGAEHETLMDLAKTGKIAIYGLAWNDTAGKIARWIGERGNPYLSIGIDEHGESTVPLALTGVPETFVFDKSGGIAYHYSGPLTKDITDNIIVPLAEKLNAQ